MIDVLLNEYKLWFFVCNSRSSGFQYIVFFARQTVGLICGQMRGQRVTGRRGCHDVEICGYGSLFNSVRKVTKVDRTSHCIILSITGS
jgi:hypothetical protein